MYKPTLSKIKLAFRNSISDQVENWKLNNPLTGSEVCPITGEELNSRKAEADHADKSFAQILDEFLSHQNRKLENIRITSLRVPGRLVLNDIAFEIRWKNWHKEHASFRWTTSHGNKTSSDRGYRKHRGSLKQFA